MSLILDALSRAEGEKRQEGGGTPDILTPTTAPERRSVTALKIVLVLLALLMLGTLALSVLREAGDDDPSTVSAPEATSVPSAPPTPRPEAPSVVPVEPRPSTVIAAAAPETVPAAEVRERRAVEDPRIADLYAATGQKSVDDATGQVEAPPPTTAAVEPEPDSQATAQETAAVSETPVDIEAVLREVRAEAAAAELAPHPVSLLEDQSQRFRDRVPTLMYLRHDYNSAGRSTVLINGQALGRGQRSRGVEIVDILPDSVILRFEGTEFRLRALNSWVNL